MYDPVVGLMQVAKAEGGVAILDRWEESVAENIPLLQRAYDKFLEENKETLSDAEKKYHAEQFEAAKACIEKCRANVCEARRRMEVSE